MTDEVMTQHYVTFYSPGTFFSETTTEEVDSWDVEKAKEMAKTIKERYDAVPYSFQFTTRGRTGDELDAKEIARSPTYFLGGSHGKLLTLEDVENEGGDNQILISNMKGNGYDYVYQTIEGWKTTIPFTLGEDILLD